jgi:hypothetical protein
MEKLIEPALYSAVPGLDGQPHFDVDRGFHDDGNSAEARQIGQG